MKTQSEDENVAAFIQAIRKFQTTEATDQSQSVYERELNEVHVVIAAYQSLPEKARVQIVFVTIFGLIIGLIAGIISVISSIVNAYHQAHPVQPTQGNLPAFNTTTSPCPPYSG